MSNSVKKSRRSLLAWIPLAGLWFVPQAVRADDKPASPTGLSQEELDRILSKLRALEAQISAASEFSPPVGTVMAYLGEWTAAKEVKMGWLLCDGRTLTQKEYPELFAEVAPSLLGDNGILSSEDFQLPDCRGLFLRGIDERSPADGGRDPDGPHRLVGSVQEQMLASHRHRMKLTGGGHTHQVGFAAAVEGGGGDTDDDPHGAHQRDFNVKTGGSGEHEHIGMTGDGDTYDQPDGGGVETRPANIGVRYIIKARSTRPVT